jgi:hypothetical protein
LDEGWIEVKQMSDEKAGRQNNRMQDVKAHDIMMQDDKAQDNMCKTLGRRTSDESLMEI